MWWGIIKQTVSPSAGLWKQLLRYICSSHSRSFGVVLCSNRKDYWCFINVPARLLSGRNIYNSNIYHSNHYYLDMVLAKVPWYSSVCGETFDFRLRATSKFLLSWVLHMNWHVTVPNYRSVSVFSMLNLISQYHFLIDIYTLMHIKETRNYEQ